MEENIDNNSSSNNEEKKEKDETNYGLLKISQLKKRTNAFRYLLRQEDIVVAVDGIVFRGESKKLNNILRLEDKTILTIQRKDQLFQLSLDGPLGVKLTEISREETSEIIEKYNQSGLDKIEVYRHYEVYRGAKNRYNVIEDSQSILASLLPPIWLMHQRLFAPLALLIFTYILLGSIAWWMFLASWVLISVYMSKGSVSLLRGYAMLKNMKLYMYISSKDLIGAQKTIRNIDKKSHFDFSMINLPDNIDTQNLTNKNKNKGSTENIDSAATI